jgi:hypothetical protein
MFWGKGDSSKLTPEERQVLEYLRRLEETGHIVALTPENTQVALAAVRFFAAVTATSGVLAGARNVMLWIGGLLVMFWTMRDTIVQFIKTAAGGAG